MPPSHQPLLANLLGYAAGALVFSIFVGLLVRDRAWRRPETGPLTLASALVAAAWNAGSLLLLFHDSTPLLIANTATLSLLPALLLDLHLEGRLPFLKWTGYLLSAAAVALHFIDAFLAGEELHRRTLTATALGFAILIFLTVLLGERRLPAPRRALAAMALTLFSLSFTHFHNEGSAHAWPAELLVHHAGIPVGLFILMQDYRFVLLDAFVRFLANTLLAGAFTWAAAEAAYRLGWVNYDQLPASRVALMALGSCAVLVAFSLVRGLAQQWLTRAIFRRGDESSLLAALRRQPVESEDAFRQFVREEVARFFDAEPGEPGRRRGGRPYLSEDLALLRAVDSLELERLEEFRHRETQRLLQQAELRALQAQIHPHFLFNAFNALYGLIPKQAEGARRTVLNLADIFRYFLRNEKKLIELGEELRIVRAYLEIEALRLGPKLRVEIDVAPEAEQVRIPVLSVQPLVENAVRHGIAPFENPGLVRVSARREGSELWVQVADSGPGFDPKSNSSGTGTGLENVRQRLHLCYPGGSELRAARLDNETRVSFRVQVN